MAYIAAIIAVNVMILSHIQNMINIRGTAQLIIDAYDGGVYARTVQLLSNVPKVQVSDETVVDYATRFGPVADSLYKLLHGLYIIQVCTAPSLSF